MTHVLAVTAEPTALDVLQKVDAFYATSWQHLLVVVAVIGVVAPVLFQFYQWKLARAEESRLRAKIGDDVAEGLKTARRELADAVAAAERKIAEMASSLRAEQQQSIKGAQEELQRGVQGARGAAQHVQGMMLNQLGQLSEALTSFLGAAFHQAMGHDEGNLRRVLSMVERIPETLGPERISDQQRTLWEDAKRAIQPPNRNDAYTDVLRKLDETFKEFSPKRKEV